MKFEIVDFYPLHRNPKWKKLSGRQPIGSLHVYWVDQQMDLRGILVYISAKSGIFLSLPFLTNFDLESKKVVRYPAFSFTDPDRSREFEDFVKTHGIPIVEKYLQEHPKFDKRLKSNEVTNG